MPGCINDSILVVRPFASLMDSRICTSKDLAIYSKCENVTESVGGTESTSAECSYRLAG